MDVKAIAKYVKIAPNKAMRVATVVRGKTAIEAVAILKVMPLKGARIILKVLNSAIANAENNNKFDKNKLIVSKAQVDGGPLMKRFSPRARGRSDQIKKRTSHITVAVKERN